ncbi:polysaccharide biosynthesis tyrosine autokinase [Microvirga sp. SRT01]|uniref:non-specific protein-tyrosine kinase n=1 Tax=Sphingomonas longa TaxID=2778730 RepID=A0ABS2D9A6_9SPHN|nr:MULTISPECIES: polysaccharide biosynthesis tyrosine autokinase [Alphaproteobacteria]MBM6577483.1 polysaccharide biosynthesis tyrosine autokinase [Sphingomonas sp. BT552]MBR7710528.1 polysaccharide biosynthesis tyrosine autokinase [Microvirga sp. SRT01]
MATLPAAYDGVRPMLMPIARPAPSPGIMDLIKTYRRHLLLFVLVAGGIMAVVTALTLLQPKSYTATASLVIAPRPAEIGSDRTTPLNDPAADSSVDTQVELLKSRTLAGLVVDDLGLARAERFAALTDTPTLRDRIPLLAPTRKPVAASARRDAAIAQLQQRLEVHRTAQTFVLTLSFAHPDRHLAMEVVNGFARQFVAQSVAVKREGADSSHRLLRSQLDDARQEVEAADGALGRYKVANNLMSIQGGTIAEQQLSSLDEQVAQARAGEAEAAARLATARRQLARGSSGDDLGEALGSPVIQQLRSQRAVVSAQVADLGGRYGPKYPPLAAAQRQVDDIDAQIQGEIRRTISNLEAQREVASRRTGSLAGSASAARSQVATNNVASIALGGLQLRSETAHQRYAALLNRVNEIGAQAATTQPDARIASLAALPVDPTSPNVPINLLVGGLLATAIGLGVVFLRQGTDRGIRTLEDVEGRLQLPYLAGLPTLGSAVRDVGGSDPISALVDHSQSAYAEGYRNLAASVLEAAGSGKVRTIALTSALPNEGKTTASIGLARIVAMSGPKVVLVDADMRRPSIASALGLRPDVGLQQVLDGEATLDEALVRDSDSPLYILPMLRAGIGGTQALNNGSFDRLIEDLKVRFDVVIFDASPVLPVVDGRLVAKKVDSTVLLVRWRKTPDAAVEMAVHLLQTLGVKMTGVALSRVDLHALARSGYGDPAQFMGSYAGYYAN